jgi:hypothetical protein
MMLNICSLQHFSVSLVQDLKAFLQKSSPTKSNPERKQEISAIPFQIREDPKPENAGPTEMLLYYNREKARDLFLKIINDFAHQSTSLAPNTDSTTTFSSN